MARPGVSGRRVRKPLAGHADAAATASSRRAVAWLARRGEAGLVATGELAIDLDIPGYDAAWRIDHAKFHATLSVIDDQGALSYTSSVSQSIGGGLAPAPTRDDARARVTP